MRPNGGAATETFGLGVLFAALGDKTRLRVVWRLCDEEPMSIARLTAGSWVTRQAIWKHLRVMEEARGYLALISKHWDVALERLRGLVEEEALDNT